MSNSSRCRRMQSGGVSCRSNRSAEPEVRRWPHPVECAKPQRNASLSTLQTALDEQTSLLREIREALVQQMPSGRADNTARR